MQISFLNLPLKTLQRLPTALGTKTKILNKVMLDLALASLFSIYHAPFCLIYSSPAKPSFSYLHL